MSRATQARVAKRLAAKAADLGITPPDKPAAVQGEVFSIKAEDAYRFGFRAQIVARLTGELGTAQKQAKEAMDVIIAASSEGGKYRITGVDPDAATVTRIPNPDYVPKP